MVCLSSYVLRCISPYVHRTSGYSTIQQKPMGQRRGGHENNSGACVCEDPVDHLPMVPPSHVIPTAQVVKGFFRNPEHPPLSSPLWVLVCIISQNQRVETLSCTI